MTVLEIDAGNTRCKWRLVSGVSKGVSKACAYNGELPGLIYTEHEGVTSISIACVATGERLQTLQDMCEAKFNLTPWVAKSTASCGPVTNGYDECNKLGVDRWLAVLAAFATKRQACWVIDFGSALTLDYVDVNGAYKGGYIVPGLAMMVSSLNQGTGNINVSNDVCHDDVVLPSNTSTAVNKGCISMLQNFVISTTATFPGAIFLTGGDAAVIMSGCDSAMEYRPDIVLDGLAILKNNNAKKLMS